MPSQSVSLKLAPYLHDGSIEMLEEMVQIMALHRMGEELSDLAIADIVSFLGSLTGEVPEDYIAMPELLESGPDTPKPGGGS